MRKGSKEGFVISYTQTCDITEIQIEFARLV